MFPLAKYSKNLFVKILSISVAELLYTLAQGLKLKKGKKEGYMSKGSSYHNQEVFDIANANKLIKIFGMIIFTYEKHLKEKNSITSLKAGTQ